MDILCFFGTFVSVFRSDGVVEGGTGSINKTERQKDIENTAVAVDGGENSEKDI